MGCSVRTNRHGCLAFRLYFHGLESHEGTKLKDTPENRRKVDARARVIDQEIREGAFDYLRWFPTGNLVSRFQPELESAVGRIVTVRAFFRYISTLLAAGAKPLFVCRQTGTSLEMIEKHYGDARVDAEHLDEIIGGFDPPTRNPAGTPSVRSGALLSPKPKEPSVLPRVPRRAGDRGRTGDVQLGKLSGPLWGKGSSAAVAEIG